LRYRELSLLQVALYFVGVLIGDYGYLYSKHNPSLTALHGFSMIFRIAISCGLLYLYTSFLDSFLLVGIAAGTVPTVAIRVFSTLSKTPNLPFAFPFRFTGTGTGDHRCRLLVGAILFVGADITSMSVSSPSSNDGTD